MKILKNKKLALSIFFLFLVLGFFSFSFAQGLETNWPPSPGGKILDDDSTLLDFIDYVYRWGILIGGLAAFFALIIAGFKYLTSVGDPSKMADAKERIIAALAGLLLLLSSFIILNTINPDLTTLELPTTAVGGFKQGTIGSGPSNKPCEEVQIFQQINYQGMPILAYFNDPAKWAEIMPPGMAKCTDPVIFCQTPNPVTTCWCPEGPFLCPEPGINCIGELTINECIPLGADDFWGMGGKDIPILSVKVEGDCVIHTYSESNCSGDQGSFFLSDLNKSDQSKQDIHSLMLVDRQAPEKPEVVNGVNPPGLHPICPIDETLIPNPIGAPFKDASNTCQIKLSGTLNSLGNPPNDLAKLYFIYGESPMKLSYTFPHSEDPEDKTWKLFPEPSGMLVSVWKKLIKKDPRDLASGPVPYSYVITGLDPDPEKTYYWTAKAVTQSGGKYDKGEPLCKFRFIDNSCGLIMVQKVTP